VTVTYQTSSPVAGTGVVPATAGADYTAVSAGQVKISIGSKSQTFTVDVLGDDAVESNEQFTVTLTAANRATVGTAKTATATIRNTAAAPSATVPTATVAVSPATLTEGNTGTQALSFTITLSGAAPTGGAAIPWTLTGRSTGTGVDAATAGTDFTTTGTGISLAGGTYTGTLRINEGQTRGAVTVNVAGDRILERTEALTLTLGPTGLRGATLGATTTATATITDDDTPIPVATVVGPAAPVAEPVKGAAPGKATFTVNLSAVATQEVTVTYQTSSPAPTTGVIPATAGADYTAVSAGQVKISIGSKSQTFTVDVLGDDAVESNEQFTVTLTAANGATVGTAKTATATIRNTAAAPIPVATVSVGGPVSGFEGSSARGNDDGTGPPVSFVVSLDRPAAVGGAVIPWTLTGRSTGTGVDAATAQGDFTTTATTGISNVSLSAGTYSGVLTIPEGQRSGSVVVRIMPDRGKERDEAFVLTLGGSSALQRARLGATRSATYTIRDDDLGGL